MCTACDSDTFKAAAGDAACLSCGADLVSGPGSAECREPLPCPEWPEDMVEAAVAAEATPARELTSDLARQRTSAALDVFMDYFEDHAYTSAACDAFYIKTAERHSAIAWKQASSASVPWQPRRRLTAAMLLCMAMVYLPAAVA